jgi:hypothetical protein
VRDHAISIPSVKNTEAHGLPNACRSCHLLDATSFEREPFARWYPDAERHNHRVDLADAIAGGRAGARDALEGLRALREDVNPVYRAGAVYWLSNYGEDVDAALADAHPMVRRAAIRGVAARDPAALEPLLTGDEPVLRRAAALCLATPEWTVAWNHLRTHRELLPRVRAALEATLALRNDDGDAYAALARVLDLAGDAEGAATARTRAAKLQWPNR